MAQSEGNADAAAEAVAQATAEEGADANAVADALAQAISMTTGETRTLWSALQETQAPCWRLTAGRKRTASLYPRRLIAPNKVQQLCIFSK